MWFKQVQIFKIDAKIHYEELLEGLKKLAFRPCLASHFSSKGWVSPIEVDASVEDPELARRIDGFVMLCLQIEEKILPATVVRQELANKVREIEQREDRKVRAKERLTLKDEVTFSLLPRAFSKFSKVYAYIDTRTGQLVLSTTSDKKTTEFLATLTKSLGEEIYALEPEKLSPIITQWLKNHSNPSGFVIEKTCMLQDPNHQHRIIRAQNQDLFANSIQALINDGCEVQQLALSWQEQVKFVLSEGLLLQRIKFHDDVILQSKDLGLESRDQQFDASFMIMAKTFAKLFPELLRLFVASAKPVLEPA